MLSILIPTYNYSIVELATKVHKQAISASIPFEIIVIDDASTHQNIVINNKSITELEYCEYFINEKNLGRTETRNLLAKKASFNILLFLDADVIPKYNDFIKRFDLLKNKDCDVIYGGVCYHHEKPKKEQLLRWKYGHKKETKTVEDRLLNPYTIVSSSLVIKKSVFYKNNTLKSNTYGLDILFSGNLFRNKVQVKHIDNPVYHLGLENSSSFIKKSKEAVKSTYLLEENKQIDNNVRPLQKSYLFLKKWKLDKLTAVFLKPFINLIETNLLSNHPSMFLFDLYRLNYFIELKNKS